MFRSRLATFVLALSALAHTIACSSPQKPQKPVILDGAIQGFAGASFGPTSGGPVVFIAPARDASVQPRDATSARQDGGAAPTMDAGPGAAPSDAGVPSEAASNQAADATCPKGPFASNPLPQDAKAVQVCAGMTFTEGPVWHAHAGALYFSDFDPNDASKGRIMRLLPGGSCTVFVPSIGSNGLALMTGGDLLACRHDDQSLATIDPSSGQATTLVANFMGAHFESPNDATVRSDGSIYFSDPGWQLGSRMAERPQGFYRRDPSGQLSFLALSRANGVTLSPDESRLYVSNDSSVLAYDVAGDGSLGNGRVFLSRSSDGMTVDCAGNLYVTGAGGVAVYAASGAALGTLALAETTTNVAFGGVDRKTLYITGSTMLYAAPLLIPGYPN